SRPRGNETLSRTPTKMAEMTLSQIMANFSMSPMALHAASQRRRRGGRVRAAARRGIAPRRGPCATIDRPVSLDSELSDALTRRLNLQISLSQLPVVEEWMDAELGRWLDSVPLPPEL